jgi:hypothetical protein
MFLKAKYLHDISICTMHLWYLWFVQLINLNIGVFCKKIILSCGFLQQKLQ